MYGLILN